MYLEIVRANTHGASTNKTVRIMLTDESTPSIVILVPGSVNMRDWIINANFPPIRGLDGSIYHRGFHDAFEEYEVDYMQVGADRSAVIGGLSHALLSSNVRTKLKLTMGSTRLSKTHTNTIYVSVVDLVCQLVTLSGLHNINGYTWNDMVPNLSQPSHGINNIIVVGHSQGGAMSEILCNFLRNEDYCRERAYKFWVLFGQSYPYGRGAWHPCVSDLTFGCAPSLLLGDDLIVAGAGFVSTGKYAPPKRPNNPHSLSILATNIGNVTSILVKPLNKLLHPVKQLNKVGKAIGIIDKKKKKDDDTKGSSLDSIIEGTNLTIKTVGDIVNSYTPEKASDPIVYLDGAPFVTIEQRRHIVQPILRSHPLYSNTPIDPIKFINEIENKFRNKIRKVPFIGATVSALPNLVTATFAVSTSGAGIPEAMRLIAIAYHQYSTYLHIIKDSGVFKDSLYKTMKKTQEYHPYDVYGA